MQLTDFSAYLMPGEHVLWWGEPRQGIVFTAGDIFAIPFSLFWGGFAMFWEYSVVTQGADTFGVIWGIPFVAVGLYIVAGRFFFDAWTRRQTAYALTDRRALIIRAGAFGKTTSVNLGAMSDVQLTETSSGRGTIQFGSSPSGNWGGFRGWPGTSNVPSFFGIEDARSVFNKIQPLLAGRR